MRAAPTPLSALLLALLGGGISLLARAALGPPHGAVLFEALGASVFAQDLVPVVGLPLFSALAVGRVLSRAERASVKKK